MVDKWRTEDGRVVERWGGEAGVCTVRWSGTVREGELLKCEGRSVAVERRGKLNRPIALVGTLEECMGRRCSASAHWRMQFYL
ncbi:hypothetical protein E2C01_088878 [Portunus trituberculatus]|uniref:Uncharacterized protein n=1 Tax=Portunus trituberculatus TaxID=210409 RepID=A0A5B7JL15_PORTR|nr:hypothetical protein [Portunus trituberculatus]